MEQFYRESTWANILIPILLSMAIFGLFRILTYLPQLINLSVKHKKNIHSTLRIIELCSWLLFLVWCTQYLYNHTTMISLIPLTILIIIILWIGWYFIRDMIAGIIFKGHKCFKINDHISLLGISGKIGRLGLHCIEIEDAQGQYIYIPYHLIAREITTRMNTSLKLNSYSFNLKLKNTPGSEPNRIIASIREAILTLPWSSQQKEPIITIHTFDQQMIELTITIFSVNEIFLKKTEQYVAQKFGNMSNDIID